MLDEAGIGRLLHASKIIDLDVGNPHGPLGLEQLAGVVARARGEGQSQRVERPISLSVEAWTKLNDLARAHALRADKPTSASEVAAVLLEGIHAAGDFQNGDWPICLVASVPYLKPPHRDRCLAAPAIADGMMLVRTQRLGLGRTEGKRLA